MSTTEYQYSIGLCQFTTRLRGGRTLDKPVLERDMHYCPAHRLPECVTCTNIMIDSTGWKNGQCPECIKEEIPIERS